MQQAYLDNAATTAPSRAVRAAMIEALDDIWGNPSSAHTLGVAAERLVTEARRQVAAALAAAAEEIVFTSGGTEANTLAILGAARARARRRGHIITTNVEHSSVTNVCALLESEGLRVTRLAADENGLVRTEQVLQALTPATGLVTMIWVNNEVGAIQPVLETALQVKGKDAEVLVHADGVQALGNVPLRLGASSLDLASFSAHKIRGPKGIGALWVRQGVNLLSPRGAGSQERGLRPGTENVPGIAGFGAAAAGARFDADTAQRMARLRDSLWQSLEASLNGRIALRRNGPPHPAERAPHILNVSLPGLRGEVLVHALADQGVYASTGSACSARRGAGSATLRSMGLSAREIEGALRLSLSPQTTSGDVDYAAAAIATVALQLYQFAR